MYVYTIVGVGGHQEQSRILFNFVIIIIMMSNAITEFIFDVKLLILWIDRNFLKSILLTF